MNAFDHINLLVKIAQAGKPAKTRTTAQAAQPQTQTRPTAQPQTPKLMQKARSLATQHGGTMFNGGRAGFHTKNGVPVYVSNTPIQNRNYRTIQKDVMQAPGNSFSTQHGGSVRFGDRDNTQNRVVNYVNTRRGIEYLKPERLPVAAKPVGLPNDYDAGKWWKK